MKKLLKKLMAVLLSAAMVLNLVPGINFGLTAYAQTTGFTDGTYDFANLGTAPDTDGYVSLGDKFKVEANKYTQCKGIESGTTAMLARAAASFISSALDFASAGWALSMAKDESSSNMPPPT